MGCFQKNTHRGEKYKKKNYNNDRKSEYVYFAGTLDAAIWGVELAEGDGKDILVKY